MSVYYAQSAQQADLGGLCMKRQQELASAALQYVQSRRDYMRTARNRRSGNTKAAMGKVQEAFKELLRAADAYDGGARVLHS